MATLAVLGGLWVRWRTAVCSGLEPRWVAVGMLSLLCLAVAPSAMAGTLTNVSVTAGNYTVGATTAYTFRYTTPVGLNAIGLHVRFPGGFTTPPATPGPGSCADVTVTLNGNPAQCGGAKQGGSPNYTVYFDTSAGDVIQVTLRNVVNGSSTGVQNFVFLEMTDWDDTVVNSASPAPSVTLTAPAPTVTEISPTSGATAGGTSVTITGTNFTGATGVTFGGTAATSYTVNSATQITATTPAHAAGAVNVVATTPAGSGTLTSGFTYITPPTVTAISPTSGPTAGGTAVTLTGTGFVAGITVSIAGTDMTNVVVVSATSITATTPAHSSGGVEIEVCRCSTDGLRGTLYPAYTYALAPTVTAISPTSGTTAGGTSITLTGTNLTGATGVTIGGTAATSVVVVSKASITATTPAHAVGAVDVVATTAGGSGTLTGGFTYVAAPTVTAISPTSGTTAGGTSVTLTGTNLTGTTGVTIGGTAATNVVVVNATSVTATTSAHAAGAVDVVATTAAGSGTLTSGFTYGSVVNGTCGSANNTASAFVPNANLCSAGTAGSVANASPWTWTCTGSGPAHTDASCSAPNAPTPSGSVGRAVVAATDNWVVDTANSTGFVPANTFPALPAGATCLHGVLGMRLMTGTAGSAATVTITYPNALPAGTVYWKYGKTAAIPTAHWYQFAGAVISGNTITLTITDGGNGDDDLIANSVILDPGGPGGAGIDVPTLPEWALILLTMLLGGVGYVGLRRRGPVDGAGRA